MRDRLALIALLLGAVTAASADDVAVRTKRGAVLPYNDGRVFHARDGRIFFTPGGKDGKALTDVVSISIRRQFKLNEAEKLMKQGKAAEAAAVYDAALEQANQPWLKRLVRYRRLQAMNQAGMVGKGAAEWLALVDESDAAGGVVALRPRKAGPPKSKANAQAIRLLASKEKVLKKGDYYLAVCELLLDVYKAEGRTKEAEALNKKILGDSSSGNGGKNGNGSEDPNGGALKTRTGLQAQLKAVAYLIEQGKADQALAEIRKNLKQYGPGELPRALLLSGRARLAMAGADAAKKRERLGLAGLDFMHVMAYFPDAPEAPEALYHAGRISAELGNANAAKKAYQMIVRRYDKSEFAKRAKADLKRIIDNEESR